MKKTLTLSILLVGLSSMASQVVLLREFLIIFHGNELSIGLILGLWLFLGAIGSGLLGLFVDRISNKVLTIAICQFLLSALFPLTLVLTRLIRPILGVSPAEMIGIFPLLLSGTLILAPICIIFGFLFSLNCKAIGSGARGVGYVYILEAVGSSVGGLLISLVLIKYLNSLTIVAVLSTLNLALSVYLLSKSEKQTLLRTILFGFNILLILAFVFLFSTNRINSINDDLVKLQWKPYQLLDSENSIYGNVVVVEEKNQISFFDNGLHLFSVPDRLSSEEQVHFAMLMHPNPRKILVVGGGVGGVLNEILKYGVDRIDYVELDPLIIQMANTYLRKNELEILEDSRVNIKHIDGRFFIKKADIKYDCIIMNVPEPSTAGINRLYTQEFFKELRAVLSDGGIVSFGLTSAENYIGRELKDFLSCIHKTLRSVFEDVKVIPGDTAYFLSSNKEGILTYNYEALSRRIETWGIDIRFVREYYLVSRMSSERVSYIENRLKGQSSTPVNLDFKPVCYFYNIILWTTYLNSGFKKVLESTTEPRIWTIFFIFIVGLFLFGFYKIKTSSKKPYLISIMTTGISEMAFQIIVLISFQIIYGFLYYKLGLILSSFMIGLVLGGLLITRNIDKIRNDKKLFLVIQLAICAYPLVLPVLFWTLTKTRIHILDWIGSNVIFAFLPVIAGFIGGVQFPLANKICLPESKEGLGKTAGMIYSLDLIGACIGALFISIFFIPILGITKTCFALFLLNFIVFLILLVNKK